MLKNDNCLPLAAESKITLMGRNVGHHVTAPTDDVQGRTGGITLGDSIKTAKFDLNENVWNYYKAMSQVHDGSGEVNPSNAAYQSTVVPTYVEYGSGTAVVLFRRSYSEGSDPALDMGASENNRTALSLSANELDLLVEACANFSQVIVLVSSPNTMELGFIKDGANYTDPYTNVTYDFSKIKGAFWIGGLGITGTDALAKILKGEITPSGHFVDIYARDIKDNPSMVNTGKFTYTNTWGADYYGANNYTVDYEEGIYIGYKYYETAAYEASRNNYAGFDYDSEILYPFGWGSSYTTFSMAYAETPHYDSGAKEFIFKVKVKNTGNTYSGKEVIQIYVNVPYDRNGGVEKSHVSLCGFAKTGILAPQEEKTYEVRVQRDYILSYDYKDAKCYVMDAGDYKFYLSEDSHSWASIADTDTDKVWTYNQASKIEFKEGGAGSENKRKSDLVTAENLFDKDTNWKFKEYTENSVGSGYLTNFTRKNFKDSYPTAPSGNDLVASGYLLESLKKYDPSKDYSNIDSPYKDVKLHEEEQKTEVDRGTLKLADMRGVDLDDPAWDTFINQLTVAELQECYLKGGWADSAITDLGVPVLSGGDSPSGITTFFLSNTLTHYPYCAKVLMTSTWNLELARLYGDALAEEAQAQRGRTGGQAINYLFGSGANTHRNAFGGRNHEYYSEDSFIAGKMCAVEASGAGEKGLIMLVKHCAGNEQETMRQGAGSMGPGGVNENTTYTSFMNEQAIRETYMRPWEIYAKEATRTVKYYDQNGDFIEKEMSAASAIMTSYNRIGGVWSGASPIITGILQEECGFTGTSFTDAGGTGNGYMNSDFGLRTGGTTSCLMSAPDFLNDPDSNTTVYYLKKAAKIKLFNVANSNAMLGLVPGSSISYDLSPWQIGLVIGWVVLGVLTIGAVVLNVFMFRRKKD